MSKHVYIDKYCKDQAAKYEGSISKTESGIIFVGEQYDETALKAEINDYVSKNLSMICVFFGEPKFDSGLTMQLGLATVIHDSESGPEELAKAIQKSAKQKTSTKNKIIGFCLGFVLAITAVFVVRSLRPAPTPQPQPGVENLKLSQSFTDALIKAGADSIVVDGGISEEEMATIKALDLSGLGISDITPLVYATELTELNLSDNKITDIASLVALTKLEKLDISGNPIKDYSPLDYMTGIKSIKK